MKTILKYLYNAAYRKIDRRKIVDRDGVLIDRSSQVISANLYRLIGARYEEDEVKLAGRWISADDVIVECGAAIGFLACYCIKIIGVQSYFAIEANPALIPLIKRNFELNGIAPSVCEIRNLAVAPDSGVVRFSISHDFWASKISSNPGTGTLVEVQAATLDEICAGMSRAPNVLIMDIEGAEVDLKIESFGRFEKLIVETHGRTVGHERVDNFKDGIEAIGFKQVDEINSSLVFLR